MLRISLSLSLSLPLSLSLSESACSEPPKFHPSTSSEIWGTQDSTVILNCTVLLAWNSSDPSCDARLQWLREGALLNASCYTRNTTEWWAQEK